MSDLGGDICSFNILISDTGERSYLLIYVNRRDGESLVDCYAVEIGSLGWIGYCAGRNLTWSSDLPAKLSFVNSHHTPLQWAK